MDADAITIFAGSGSPRLTGRICAYLGVAQGQSETLRFSEGNLFVRILENVRGRSVYVVQTIAFPANDNFMELLFMIDALKRASADSVTAVIPYFSYAKGDKKDEPRVSIRARVCADAIEAAGADRVVTMDLHAPQIQGFFRIPVDNLYALPVLCDHIRAMDVPNPVVVSPDIGFAKRARDFAHHLGTSIAIAEKERIGHDEKPAVLDVIGDVAGKTALIVDDFTISGRTLIEVAARVLALGATDAYAVVTHGVLAAGTVARIAASPITRLLMTDTVESQPDALSGAIEVVSVAPLFGEAIKRIHDRESISAMFPL
jgi:ribose-phosphate pyrophosphokinase